jgi:hypothetical protein
MNTYLDALMAREIVLDDWELMESARYAFKIGARLVEWEFSRPAKARLSTDGGSVSVLVVGPSHSRIVANFRTTLSTTTR